MWGCLPQERWSFIRVVLESDGRIAVFCMWIFWYCLSCAKSYGVLWDGSWSLGVYIFVSLIRASLCPCGWAHWLNSQFMWSGILVPTALPAGECVQGQMWLTYYLWIALGSPCQSFLKLRHTWRHTGTVEIATLIWITVIGQKCIIPFLCSFAFWVRLPDCQGEGT